ncbi:MAG TPA: response regulator transcription factor [Chloroflexota bacterium]|nr:response regulator transcription factor [Chloroflexota bacterium]
MDTRRRTVLVVDDEAILRDTLAFNLQREGYDVLLAGDGQQGLAMARDRQPDLVLLDLMMPGMDGLSLCTALRRDSSTPVLVLTAKDDEVDRVVGLEMGADDYITKPFSMRELLARVKAHLRRSDSLADRRQGLPDAGEPVVRGPIVIHPAKREVRRNGRAVALRPKEFDLLLLLASNPGIVLTREVLLDRVWGAGYAGLTTRTVDVHVNALRKKLEDDPAEPRYVQTVRGVGYRFAE